MELRQPGQTRDETAEAYLDLDKEEGVDDEGEEVEAADEVRQAHRLLRQQREDGEQLQHRRLPPGSC